MKTTETSSMRRPARRIASRSRRVGAAWAGTQVPSHPPEQAAERPQQTPEHATAAPAAPAAAFHAPAPHRPRPRPGPS